MSFRMNLYHRMVNSVPGIQERYQKRRNESHGRHRLGDWGYLLKLNISYYLLHNKELEQPEKYPVYEAKVLHSGTSESSMSYRESPEEFARKLAEYDVVSFDVFDTLVLRPFSQPTDLFFLLGEKLAYPDFKRIRQEMEWKARERKYKEAKSYEVTIDEIYELLSQETGIEKTRVLEMEVALEQEYCFANPYMFRVVQALREMGRPMVITSDMYLRTEHIRGILQSCGYPEFGAYYVSCDIGKSKSVGDLYEYMQRQQADKLAGKGVAHVGDNDVADIQNAQKYGCTPFRYVNVNVVGEPYRPEDMSAITGSIYRGIVNAHIHNGLLCCSREYEYGFIYGGLFVTGYCRFIHDYVQEHEVDKILFLARDGDILSKAYHILYPEEDAYWEYVYWSRLAATKLAAGAFKYDYFRRFLQHKVNQQYSLKRILTSMELEDMLPELCQETGLSEQAELTDRNVDKVKAYLMAHWDTVLEHYAEQVAAGKLYYGKVLEDCRNAIAVDIGWAGSGAITLNYLVNQVWKLDCPITGLIAGTNSCHNAEPDSSETFFKDERLVCYMYSQERNRDIWKYHDAGKNHNLYWEIFLDAPMGSFKGFYLNPDGTCECRLKEATADVNKIREIQSGILDFVQVYGRLQKHMGAMAKISGRDAYAPMISPENKINDAFMRDIAGLMDDTNVE